MVIKGDLSHKKGWQFPKTRPKEGSADIKAEKKGRKGPLRICPKLLQSITEVSKIGGRDGDEGKRGVVKKITQCWNTENPKCPG